MGCIGLSLDEFCALEFDEFESVCEAWRKMDERRNREAWERLRLLAAVSIQPHVKKKITPRKLIPLPWDNDNGHCVKKTLKELSPDERLKRFQRLADS